MKGPRILPLAPAHLAGAAALVAAALLAFIDLHLSAIPLALFLITCFAAPFFPRSGFYLPVIHKGERSRHAVALTFDDGPDPTTTPMLLDLLARKGVAAAFFLVGSKAEAHPNLVKRILDGGHEIGNHSYRHDPLLMLRGTMRLRKEILRAREALARLGVLTFAFRPPVGITSPRLGRPLIEAGSHCVNFSRRALDAGNRRITGLAKKITGPVQPGDIILLHDTAPPGDFNRDFWLDEVGHVVDGIREKDLGILPLSELTGRPVSAIIEQGSGIPEPSPFDCIAALPEDEGVWGGTYSRKERKLVEANLFPIIEPTHRVLDIGLGGPHALALSRRGASVSALVPSGGAAALLEKRAKRAKIDAIDILTGDIAAMKPEGPKDIVTCFSFLEYIPECERLIMKLSSLLKPGGLLYLTTARKSCAGLIAMSRAALRNGILPLTRSEGRLARSLENAGFRDVRMASHSTGRRFSPQILEVTARRGG
ncbi:MAG: polysaccharide deacetylase family protein [Spirochaetes bacterium]|nr:polysaccharide deacetylase family protein [Spirochaetota bacterium]